MLKCNDNEQYLICEIKKGNKEVFEIIYKRYFKNLLIFAEYHTYDKDTAYDIVQESFVTIYEKFYDLKIESSLKSYLYQTVRNKCIDYLKHLHIEDKYKKQLLEAQINSCSIDISFDKNEDQRIKNAINLLPEQCKKILILSTFEEKTYKEIASLLDISINTVKTQISRAYKSLRKSLLNMKALFLFFF